MGNFTQTVNYSKYCCWAIVRPKTFRWKRFVIIIVHGNAKSTQKYDGEAI